MERKIVTLLEYGELEKIIRKIYRIDVELLDELEATNYTWKHFRAVYDDTDGEYWKKYWQPMFEKWEQGEGEFPPMETVLHDLCCKGQLLFGDFFIDMSW